MNAETKHTPGPWGMETVRTSCGVCHKVGPWPHKWRAGTTMSACIYDDYPSPPEGTDTMLANARLIAAAPEIAEALRDWLDAEDTWDGDFAFADDDRIARAKEAARSALSKARG